MHAAGAPGEVLVAERLRQCFGIRVHTGHTPEGPYVLATGIEHGDPETGGTPPAGEEPAGR